MQIFHGSLEKVEHPVILIPNRKLDYGEGFYTTTSEKQAKEWVERRMFERHANAGYINVYEFDDMAMSHLKPLIFSEPNKEWAEFVMANRTKKALLTTTTSYMVQWPTTGCIYSSAYMSQVLLVLRR